MTAHAEDVVLVPRAEPDDREQFLAGIDLILAGLATVR
jgi:hypothetical protein